MRQESLRVGWWRRRPDSNRRIGVLQTPPLDHLGTSPRSLLAAPRGFEPRFTDSKSGVLPLDEGASTPGLLESWSGRRDSNPRPSHWQCDALPTEPLPRRYTDDGAESQIRTGDTALFRRVLYQLSYLGSLAACHGDLKHQLVEDTLRGERAQWRAARFTRRVGFRPIRWWWAVRGSNPRPPRCKRGALPTELTARCSRLLAARSHEVWCPDRDLNPDDLRHTPLKRTRIPIPPPGHRCCVLDAVAGIEEGT